MSKYGGYWCEKHEKKHTELTMGYYGCKKCSDEFDEELRKKDELREQGYENPEEVLKQLEIGFQQIKDGKGMTTEEMKAKLKERREISKR